MPQFRERDASGGIEVEDALEKVIAGGRDGENGPEEIGVVEVGFKGFVGGAGLFPRVATTGEVDEDDAEGPDVVVKGGVVTQPLEETALTFCD